MTRTEAEETRLQGIRERLIRGDKKRIAELAGVHRVWVSYVIEGRGTSEPVLKAAEELIRQRDQEAEKAATITSVS